MSGTGRREHTGQYEAERDCRESGSHVPERYQPTPARM
jgi:hypothetical protein